jgi:hypothetical protein
MTLYLAETVLQASSTAPTGSWIPFFWPSGHHVSITDVRSAQANGFSQTDPEWANLGQGAPEVSRLAIPHQLEMLTLRVSPHPPSHVVRVSDDQVGDLPGGPPRPKVIDLTQWGEDINEYSPTVGVKELREAVAVSGLITASS